jgi:hypothetical protein
METEEGRRDLFRESLRAGKGLVKLGLC